MKLYEKILMGLIAVISAAGIFFPRAVNNEAIGGNFDNGQWTVIDQFTGYETKRDPSKIPPGSNPVGQNTMVNDADRVSIRNYGFTQTGTASTTANAITSLHTFRKRNGENIMMASTGTMLLYYDESRDDWETLSWGYTSGQKFDFADFNINADLRSYVYFGNATESFSRWTGAHTNLSTAATSTAGTLFVDSTTGFDTSGSLVMCDTTVTYTGVTATTFTGASGTPVCALDRGIAQAVQTYAANPKGNIYLVANNRLFIAGVASSTQAVFFSAYTDATTFSSAAIVTDSTDASSGIFNLGEGGGGVIAAVQDESSIYFLKKSIIYKATLSDTIYTLGALKTFDGKSQTTGGQNNESTFTGANSIFFVTPDKQLMNLARLESIDYPQIDPISEPIKPTVSTISFTNAAGIFWRNEAYFAAQSEDAVANDVVLVWDAKNKIWQSPIIGWSPSTFTIYDDGTGEALYFGSSRDANVYKVTDTAVDNALGVAANWRTAELTFGLPYSMKEIDSVFVEGYTTDNTSITFSLLLDEDGFTQTYTTEFAGTETDYILDSTAYNVFGFHPFGYERFGSNNEAGKKRFRIYLNKDFRQVPFYVAQFEAASDGVAQDWEITRIGFHVREVSQPERRGLFRSFSN